MTILDIPTAINRSFLGLTMFTTRSVYLNIASIISSSVDGGGRSSGCEQGWTIPFMSRYLLTLQFHRDYTRAKAQDTTYKLSNSSPLGFGPAVLTGISCPSTSLGFSSMTCEMILGYFCDSQRKSAGTPMFGSVLENCWSLASCKQKLYDLDSRSLMTRRVRSLSLSRAVYRQKTRILEVDDQGQ